MSAHEENLYGNWVEQERNEKRGLRLSLAIALALHGALLAVVVPEYSAAPAAAPEQRVVYVLETPRFKAPPPPPTEAPRPPARPIPIPDPDPLEPEPYVSDAELAALPEIAAVDDLAFFTLPDAPPAPEPEKLVYRVGEVDPPERVHYVDPRYTEAARVIRLQGPVILQATIDEKGDVVDVRVLKGLGMGLTEAAVDAVEQWKFRPSTVGGRPVAVLYNLTVHFKLQ